MIIDMKEKYTLLIWNDQDDAEAFIYSYSDKHKSVKTLVDDDVEWRRLMGGDVKSLSKHSMNLLLKAGATIIKGDLAPYGKDSLTHDLLLHSLDSFTNKTFFDLVEMPKVIIDKWQNNIQSVTYLDISGE